MKKTFFVSFLILLSFSLALLICEVIVRIANIPGLDKNTHYTVDPLIGYGDIPYANLYYRNDRGEVVRRKFNSLGYLDVEHRKEKKKGICIYRIGFFGDSYVEARQVPIESTFFRLIEEQLKDYNVECLAFGREGGGTLVPYLNNTRWTSYFDLDSIVYVFCENDPGDNIKEIKEKTEPYFPFAYLTENGFQIDSSNRDKFVRQSKTFYYKIKKCISNHLLFSRVIKNRISLLINYGIKIRANEDDRKMATRSHGKAYLPDQNDLPSTWPDSLRRYAEELSAAILLKWRIEAQTDSKDLAVLYISRQGEMEKDIAMQDSWKPWLESFCRDNNIVFIDPTEDLIKMQHAGKEIFYDHFTIYGHQALATSFVRWFKENTSIRKAEDDIKNRLASVSP